MAATMRLDDHDGITFFYESPSASPSSSPARSTNNSVFWALNQRIDNTARQFTEVLSSQCEQQLQLIREITDSQRQEREALTRLLDRTELHEHIFERLQNTTQALTVNQQYLTRNQRDLNTHQQRLTTHQQQNKQSIRVLQREIDILKGHIRAMQQDRGRSFSRNIMSPLEGPVQQHQPVIVHTDDVEDEQEPLATAPRRVIFTDGRGRRRRLCRYCGRNFGASYCNKHEREQVCLRPPPS